MPREKIQAREYIPKYIKGEIYKNCGGRCTHCGVPLTFEEATLDHIIPLNKGGTNERDNYAILCMDCNSKKTDYVIDPEYYFRYMPEKKIKRAKALFTAYLRQVDWLDEDNLFMTDSFDLKTSGIVNGPAPNGMRRYYKTPTTISIRRLSPDEVCVFTAKYRHKIAVEEREMLASDPESVSTNHYLVVHKGQDLFCFTAALRHNKEGPAEKGLTLHVIFMVDYELVPKKDITEPTVGCMLMDILEHIRFTLKRGGITETLVHCYIQAPKSDKTAQNTLDWMHNCNKAATCRAYTDLGGSKLFGLSGISLYLYQGDDKSYRAILKRYGAHTVSELMRDPRYEELRKELEAPLLERLYGNRK